jgi:hypothetical protein
MRPEAVKVLVLNTAWPTRYTVVVDDTVIGWLGAMRLPGAPAASVMLSWERFPVVAPGSVADVVFSPAIIACRIVLPAGVK